MVNSKTIKVTKKTPTKADKVKSLKKNNRSLEEVLQDVCAQLSCHQMGIVSEALERENGTLDLPMGTGKTILSLVITLTQCKEEDMILVVLKKSLISVWIEEINKFFGDSLSYEVIHNDYTKMKPNWVPNTKLVLVTPQMLAKAYKNLRIEELYTVLVQPNHFAPAIRHYNRDHGPLSDANVRGLAGFYALHWGAMIVDECDNYYNHTAYSSVATYAICAKHRWLLSGTTFSEPRGEKLFGYYLLLNDKSVPDNLPDFLVHIRTNSFTGVRNTLVLRTSNPDFVLPKVNANVVQHTLSPTEEAIYTGLKTLLAKLQKRVNEFKRNNDVANTKMFSSYIVAMLGYLRQCVVCPLIPITSVAIKIASTEDRSALNEMFNEHIQQLKIDKWLDDPQSLCSSRVQKALELIHKHPDEQVVVFSGYRKTLDVVIHFLKMSGREVFTISGSTNSVKRTEEIENFRASKNGVMFLTYDIGSQGLNLQSCCVAMFLDFWWNSAKTAQAVARMLRRGQLSPVVFIYYLTANTAMERAIFRMQDEKQALSRIILDGKMPDNAISKLKVADLVSIITSEENAARLEKIYG